MHLKRILLIATTFVLIGAPAARSATIWVEGEKPAAQKMNRHPWWYDKVKRNQLSAGDWISNFAKGKEGTAEYRFQAPASGKYDFWVRTNPIGTKLSYRFDPKGPWRLIDMSQAIQKVNIAADGKPDLRFISWIPVGEVSLEKGLVNVSFRVHSDNSNHSALDAFVLSTEKFAPRGDGTPVRFWAVGSDVSRKPIASSQRVLVQVGTTERMTGWADRKLDFKSKDGKRIFHGREIVSVGAPPWRIANANVTVTVSNPHLTRATLLDTSGQARRQYRRPRSRRKAHSKVPRNNDLADLEQISRTNHTVIQETPSRHSR